jgi:hypothetical protein
MRRRGRCGTGRAASRCRELRAKSHPKPLPRTRPRALTLPLPPKSCAWNPFKRVAQVAEQSQSPFFAQVPFEIRSLIWNQVFGGFLLHMVLVPKRLLAIICGEDCETELPTNRHRCWDINGPHLYLNSTGMGLPMSLGSVHPAKPAHLLGLLQTCRAIYSEAIPILYKNNIFDFNKLDTLIDFQKTILPHRHNQIRILNFAWQFRGMSSDVAASSDIARWRNICNALASFTQLEELEIYINPLGMSSPYYGGKRILDVLAVIGPIKKFTVFVSWLDERFFEKASRTGNYQLKLITKSEGDEMKVMTTDEVLNRTYL